jgi:hypothetical protein
LVGAVGSGMGRYNHFLSLGLVNWERNSTSRVVAFVCAWGNAVVSKDYLTRQASMLLMFAKATTDPNIAAALVEKAADLKSQVDDSSAPDPAPLAPGVEPSAK